MTVVPTLNAAVGCRQNDGSTPKNVLTGNGKNMTRMFAVFCSATVPGTFEVRTMHLCHPTPEEILDKAKAVPQRWNNLTSAEAVAVADALNTWYSSQPSTKRK